MKKKIKIGFNAKLFTSDELRGISRHTLHLVEELRMINYHMEIHFFSPAPIHQSIKMKFPHIVFHEIKTRPIFLWNLWVLPNLLRLNQIDIYHSTNNIGVPLFGAKKFILTIHDDITHRHRSKFSFNYLWDYINYQFEYILLKKADAYITVSNDAKNKIAYSMKLLLNKIHPIYNGSNLVAINSIKREDYILYVGGLDERKNIEYLIKEINSFNPKQKLILVSKIELANQSLKKLIHQSPNIEIISNVDDSKLIELYQKARLVIIPSLEEGFGLPVIEAMQLSCPLAISRIPIFEEISGGNVHFFNPKEESSLKKLLIDILNNESMLNKFVSIAQKYSQKFSWKQMAQETYELYWELLNK